ncbi:hypothetical protein RHMOL_Rhmol10G0084300 [Rhododendron molle]|uniref:Uncharacterized protein n=1 Tax=Rhododendron molle TaxID=49168 RepID=A0ACC0M0R9_RHOML|nr:hypothetical protein RHMOL_Rhmol10G0084300 [Rhododendron molle]
MPLQMLHGLRVIRFPRPTSLHPNQIFHCLSIYPSESMAAVGEREREREREMREVYRFFQGYFCLKKAKSTGTCH